MQYWYGIVRNSSGTIRHKQASVDEIPNQSDFLSLMEYNFDKGDVVVELDKGNHMSSSDFTKYVNIFYKSSKHVHIMDIEKLLEGY